MSISRLTNQSIFTLFPDEVMSSDAIYKSFRLVKSGEVLIKQNECFNNVIIPVSDNLKLKTGINENSQEQVGTLLAGRSANLYCFLRSLPSQYSVHAETDMEVLEIPRTEVEKWFTKYPYVKEYLMKITGNLKFRKLVKEFDGIEVNKSIMVQFLSHLNEVMHSPCSVIIQKNSVPNEVHYVSEGQYHFENQLKNQITQSSVQRKWIGWVEALCSLPAMNTILSTTNVRTFSIKRKLLLQFETDHSNELEIINNYILDSLKEAALAS